MCGTWSASPLGPICDLMWATPEGQRRLVAPSAEVAAFVTAVYRFDEVVVSPLTARVDGGVLAVSAPDLGLTLEARGGRRWPLPLLRPAWVTRHVAGPPAWRLLGVRTYGVTPTGVQEWYRASSYRSLVAARARLGGTDLGELRPLEPPVGFGFSEPPRLPSMVAVRPLLHDPTGVVARALASAGQPFLPSAANDGEIHAEPRPTNPPSPPAPRKRGGARRRPSPR